MHLASVILEVLHAKYHNKYHTELVSAVQKAVQEGVAVGDDVRGVQTEVHKSYKRCYNRYVHPGGDIHVHGAVKNKQINK